MSDPVDKAQYSIWVLQGIKRMIRRSDYFMAYVPPRNVEQDNANVGDVTDALQYAIEAIRGQLPVREEVEKRERTKRLYED